MSNPYGFQEVEGEFLDVMAQTVRLYRATGTRDKYGAETPATTYIEVPSHIEMEDVQLLSKNSETSHVVGMLFLGWLIPWLDTDTRLDLPSLVTPTGWKTTIISGVIERPGPDGIHHQEVFFGQRGATTKGYGP